MNTSFFNRSHKPALDVRMPSAATALATALLADAITDIAVVSRELSLSDAMVERIRRAEDCL
ncbi:hypothetical protein [Paraburkholderia caribensis]|uniref:hypothetical protein n=1 Tax=Paraburkholderia caribensis TaxID=75105 RepID=UPI001CC60A46|nr:hypothetical protein [Paraburkholderia caribensis]